MCTGTEHTQGWYKCRYYISIGLCLVQHLSCASYQMYQTNLTDGSQLSAHPEQKRKIRRKNGAGWSSRSCRSPVCGKKLHPCGRQTSAALCRHRRTQSARAVPFHRSYRNRAVPSVLQKSPANTETRHPALPTRDRAPSPSDQPHVDLDVAPTELRTIGTSDPVYRGHEAVGLALFRACLPPRLPAAPTAFHR